MSKIITDEKKIEDVLSRSVDKIYPDKESLKKMLLSGKQIKVYCGIDPTSNYVHIGHSTNYLLLEKLHKLGHKIIVLVGDFTAMIGDPSDKSSARVQLTKEDVLKNLKTFKEQIGKILDFEDNNNPIEFRFNSEWLAKLNFEKLIELASNFTVQQMIERDLFQKRMAAKKPLFVHEFFYPLMQGYDSVALDVDLEVGGTDQIFNMLAGRLLVSRYLNKEKCVLATTLLTNPVTGEKLMSKSLGTGVALNDSPENMFGKIMTIADAGVIQTFIDCTRLSLEEIETKKERLSNGENPKDIKIELGLEITKMYHGEEKAQHAMNEWQKTFSQKELPTDIPELKPTQYDILTVLVEAKMSPSRGEARRNIDQRGVRVNEVDIEDTKLIVKPGDIIQKGKRFFVKVI